MTNRIDHDLPFADYLNAEGYGSSDLRAFRIGPPAIVPWQRANRTDPTPSMRLGSAAHCAILTPQLLDSSYKVKPEGMSFRSKADKDLRDQWLAEGLEILTQDEWDQVCAVHSAFRGRASLQSTLDAAQGVEASVFWECSGVPCKGRPDWFTSDAVYDLKVSVTAQRDFAGVARSAYHNGWMHQLAHNRAGLAACGITVNVGRLVVISPNPPQNAYVHRLEVSEHDLDLLELENIHTRRQMAICHNSGHWPGTPDQWQTVELPASAATIPTESDLIGAIEVQP